MRRLVLLGMVAAAGLALILGCQRKDGPPVRTMVDEMMAARSAHSTIPPLTLTYGDFSVRQAYRIQDALTARLTARGRRTAGYRIVFARADEQEAWGTAEPVYARLYASEEVPDGAAIIASDYGALRIEIEVAFIMGKRVDRRLKQPEDLRPYVAGVCAALDLPGEPFREDEAKAQLVDIVASGAGTRHFAVGPIMDPAAIDLDSIVGIMTRRGQVVCRGDAAAVMGGPWQALLWLAHALLENGCPLQQGDVVLTGALDRAFAGDAEGHVDGICIGDCGPLGRVTVTVTDLRAD